MKKITFQLFIVSAFLSTSCVSFKKVGLFQDAKIEKSNSNTSDTSTSTSDEIKLRIQPLDVIKIDIKTSAGGFDNLYNTENSQNVNFNANNAYYAGYTVDAEGYVNLPIIGMVKVLNLTISEAKKILSEKKKSRKSLGYKTERKLEKFYMIFLVKWQKS